MAGWIGLSVGLLFFGLAHADPLPTQTARQQFMQGSRRSPRAETTYFCTAKALEKGGASAEAVREIILNAESPGAAVPAFEFVQEGADGAIKRVPEAVSVDPRGRSDNWVSKLKPAWSFLEGPTCLGETHPGKAPLPCQSLGRSVALRMARDGTLTLQTRAKGLPEDYFACYTAEQLERSLVPRASANEKVETWAAFARRRAVYLRAERALFDAATEAARAGAQCGERFKTLAARAELKARIRSLESPSERDALEGELARLGSSSCRNIRWAEVTDQVHLDAVLGRELTAAE
jgi:hypothetical protein